MKMLAVQDCLNRGYGFNVPVNLAKVLKISLQGHKDTQCSQYFRYYGYDLIKLTMKGVARNCLAPFAEKNYLTSGRYPCTPIEFLTFAASGIDGIHYGYVVHAPELELDEYPVGEYAPMENSGVTLMGNNTAAGFEQILSDRIADIQQRPVQENWIKEVELKLLSELSQQLNIKPLRSKARSNSREKLRCIKPLVPYKWKYVPSQDGVGVLAPEDAFTTELPCINFDDPLSENLDIIEIFLNLGFPGTALWLIKELYWNNCDNFAQIAPLWTRAYIELGRPLLANEVQREIKYRHQMLTDILRHEICNKEEE